MHRRDFLKAALVGGFSAVLLSALGASRGVVPGLVTPAEAAAETPRKLRIISRTLEINKRAANVFGLVDAEGRPGLTYNEDEAFKVRLTNEHREPTLIHWHGLRPPYEQDGVPNMPAPMLEAGNTREYDFPVGAAGTHWMHAHTLQEQNLLAAPLVVRDREEARRDEQEVVVLLHDFSFTPAEELLAPSQALDRGPRHGWRHGRHGSQ